jgi:hypothetical protein
MTTPGTGLRELMDDAVRESAFGIRVDTAAASLEGRRRRIHRRMWAAVSVAAVVVAATAGLSVVSEHASLQQPASGGSPTAEEYPQRLDYPYWDDAQPSVTGPLAGLIQRNGNVSGWWSVSPQGHLWRLDVTGDSVPSLSPDGAHLGYLHGPNRQATYVLTDQVDGTSVSFPQVGGGFTDASVEDFDHAHRYYSSSQSPSFWSPDGTNLLIRMGTTDPASTEAVGAGILGVDGTLTAIQLPEGSGGGAHPVGWLGNDHVAVLGGIAGPSHRTRVWVIDILTGRVVRGFNLPDNVDNRETSQWFGNVWGDSKLATVTPGANERIRFYAMNPSLAGRLVGTLPSVPQLADTCPLSSTSTDLYVPTRTNRDGASAILMRANGGVTVRADPRLDIVCSTWARTALDGPAHASWSTRFFGSDTGWLSWHWREVTAGILATLAVLALGWFLIMGRSRRRLRHLRRAPR